MAVHLTWSALVCMCGKLNSQSYNVEKWKLMNAFIAGVVCLQGLAPHLY